MNLQSLEFFLEVTKDLNFTKAAERLNTSQQVLSGHIKRLEDYYGVELFKRKPKITLTYAGEQLLSSAKKILAESDEIYDKLYNVSTSKRGRIRVQISPYRCPAYVPQVFPTFSKLHPHVDIELIELASTVLAKNNIRGQNADFFLGVCNSDAPDISEEFLYWEYFYLVASRELLESREPGLAKKLRDYSSLHGGISVDLIKGLPVLIHSKVNVLRPYENACFHEAGYTPDIRFETSATNVLYQLAADGIGVAFCSSLYFSPDTVQEGVEYYPLLYKGQLLKYKVNLIYQTRNEMPPYMKDFIEIVVNALRHEGHPPLLGAQNYMPLEKNGNHFSDINHSLPHFGPRKQKNG